MIHSRPPSFKANFRGARISSTSNSVRGTALAVIAVLVVLALFVRAAVAALHRDFASLAAFLLPLVAAAAVVWAGRHGRWEARVPQRAFRLVLLGGLAVRALVFFHGIYDRPRPLSDWRKYELLGQRLAHEHRYYDFTTLSGVELRAFRPPGLPLLLAMAHGVLPDRWVPHATMTAISIGCLMVGFWLTLQCTSAASLLLFAYIALSPNVVLLGSITNTQLPLLLIVLTVAGLLRMRPSATAAAVLGMMTGLAALFRSETLVLIPALLLFHVIRSDSRRDALRKAVLTATGAAAVLLPWTTRNYLVLNRVVLISSNSGSVLYSANVIREARRGGGYNGVPPDFYAANPSCDEVELDAKLRQGALAFVAAHPMLYLRSVPFRIAGLMTMQRWAILYFASNVSGGFPIWLRELLLSVEQAGGWSVLLAGGWLIWRARSLDGAQMALLAAYVLVVVPIGLVFETLDRNHFPYVLLPLMAAVTCVNGRQSAGTSPEVFSMSVVNSRSCRVVN